MHIIVGSIIALIGYMLRYKAIKQLKENFSLAVVLNPSLVTTGLYKYIRHPMYLGTLLMLLGMLIIFVPLAVMYLAFIFLADRAIQEDQHNLRHTEFPAYYKQTGMFFPKIRKEKWQTKH